MASNTKYYDNLTVSSSPHLVTSLDTTKTMLYVVAALCPAAADATAAHRDADDGADAEGKED